MNGFLRGLSLFCLYCCIVVLQGCPGPIIIESPPLIEQFTEILTDGFWTVDSVSKDEVIIQEWADFQLKLNDDNSYQTEESFDAVVWPTTGSWDFLGKEESQLSTIVRGDGVAMKINGITSLRLSLSFVISENSSETEYTFVFLR